MEVTEKTNAVDAGSTSQKITVIAEPLRLDRFSLIWKAKAQILVLAILVPVVVYFSSSLLPARYEATSLVRVVARGESNVSPQDIVRASNDLASQYSHLVNVPEVRQAASVATGMALPDFSLGATTVAGQNLVRVTARSDASAGSRDVSAAAAKAFVDYVSGLSDKQVQASAKSRQALLDQLEAQIKVAQDELGATQAQRNGPVVDPAISEAISNRARLLADLQNQAYGLQHDLASSQAVQPTLEVISADGAGKTSPKPLLYAVVALIVTLLTSMQLAVWIAARRAARVVELPK